MANADPERLEWRFESQPTVEEENSLPPQEEQNEVNLFLHPHRQNIFGKGAAKKSMV